MKKTCHWCKMVFWTCRGWQKFCRNKCRAKSAQGKYKKYYDDYRKRNREKIRSRWIARRTNLDYRLKVNEQRHSRAKALRLRIIRHLGGKCRWCKFDDWRALQVDHVVGGGIKERSALTATAYAKKILASLPGEVYQLLCANCNQIKRYECGEGFGANARRKNGQSHS